MKARTLVLAGFISILALAAAQAPKPKGSIAWSQTSVTGGATLSGKLTIDLPAGHHAYPNPPAKDYNIPVKVVSDDKTVRLVKVTYPKGETKMAGGEMTSVYEDKVVIPVEVRTPAAKGRKTIRLKVSYQLCNETSCFPPTSMVVSQPVTLR
jgi:DsbC/DsbD-like thiol-disulfide interchange protein